MAYDNPGSGGMASASEPKETMSEGMHEEGMHEEGMHEEGMHEGGEQESSLFLTPDMLPSGMKVNAGDILEFKVVNPSDADGHIEVVYNTGEDKGGKEDKGPSWEEDFRKEMSPRKDDAGQSGETGGGY